VPRKKTKNKVEKKTIREELKQELVSTPLIVVAEEKQKQIKESSVPPHVKRRLLVLAKKPKRNLPPTYNELVGKSDASY
jgi:hypothetical protein